MDLMHFSLSLICSHGERRLTGVVRRCWGVFHFLWAHGGGTLVIPAGSHQHIVDPIPAGTNYDLIPVVFILRCPCQTKVMHRGAEAKHICAKMFEKIRHL